jgi:hypothetical protein
VIVVAVVVMYDFPGPLTEEDPFADIDVLLSINTTTAALALVLGNLAGLFDFWVHRNIRFYYKGWVILASVIVSSFYHMCQTQTSCFSIPLITWVRSDHVTATQLFEVGLFAIYLIYPADEQTNRRNDTSSLPDKVVEKQKVKIKATTTTTKNQLLSLGQKKKTIQEKQSIKEIDEEVVVEYEEIIIRRPEPLKDNMIRGELDFGFTYVALLVIVFSVYIHPFSYHTFINAFIAFIALGFLKIAVYDECLPDNINRFRLSYADLGVGAFLSLIGFGCYIADSYVAYQWLHTFWHIFIYLADAFITIGISRFVAGWFGLCAWLHSRLCCCWHCACYDKDNIDIEKEHYLTGIESKIEVHY